MNDQEKYIFSEIARNAELGGQGFTGKELDEIFFSEYGDWAVHNTLVSLRKKHLIKSYITNYDSNLMLNNKTYWTICNPVEIVMGRCGSK
jgi:hypothetical protein